MAGPVPWVAAGRDPGAPTRSVGCSGIAQPAAAAPPRAGGRPSPMGRGAGWAGPASTHRQARGVGVATAVLGRPAGNGGIAVATAGAARRSATGTGTGRQARPNVGLSRTAAGSNRATWCSRSFPFQRDETLTEKRMPGAVDSPLLARAAASAAAAAGHGAPSWSSRPAGRRAHRPRARPRGPARPRPARWPPAASRAASRAACTAGSSSATPTPPTAMSRWRNEGLARDEPDVLVVDRDRNGAEEVSGTQVLGLGQLVRVDLQLDHGIGGDVERRVAARSRCRRRPVPGAAAEPARSPPPGSARTPTAHHPSAHAARHPSRPARPRRPGPGRIHPALLRIGGLGPSHGDQRIDDRLERPGQAGQERRHARRAGRSHRAPPSSAAGARRPCGGPPTASSPSAWRP